MGFTSASKFIQSAIGIVNMVVKDIYSTWNRWASASYKPWPAVRVLRAKG